MNPTVQDLLEKADTDTLRLLHRLASISPDRERRRLRAAGRAFIAPDLPLPDAAVVDATARWVVDRAARRRHLTGRVLGLVGAAGVPSDVLARALGILRLGQRLAIVYGFDLDHDRGQVALRRALASGLEVDLPEHGPLARRATDLAPFRGTVGGTLLHEVVRWNARTTSPVRVVPVLGALGSSGDLRPVGERMLEVYRRLSAPFSPAPSDDAVEVASRAPAGVPRS